MTAMNKTHMSIDFSKQRIISAQPYIASRMKLCAPLSDNDAAGSDELSLMAFHSQHFGVGIAAVSGTAAALLVSE
jgi:hypothetical protein